MLNECKKILKITDCRETLCSRFKGQGHTADVCSTVKEQAMLAVERKLGEGLTAVMMVRSRLQLSRPKKQASVAITLSRMGDEDSV